MFILEASSLSLKKKTGAASSKYLWNRQYDLFTAAAEMIQSSLVHFAFLQVRGTVGHLLHLFNTQSLRAHGTRLLCFQQPGHTNHTDYHRNMQLM